MKAKAFLKWFIENQIENTELDYIEIPGGDNLQSQEEFLEVFFSAKNVKRHIPGGDYVYLWKTEKNYLPLLSIVDKVEMILHLDEKDSIWLFRIED